MVVTCPKNVDIANSFVFFIQFFCYINQIDTRTKHVLSDLQNIIIWDIVKNKNSFLWREIIREIRSLLFSFDRVSFV